MNLIHEVQEREKKLLTERKESEREELKIKRRGGIEIKGTCNKLFSRQRWGKISPPKVKRHRV